MYTHVFANRSTISHVMEEVRANNAGIRKHVGPGGN
jgi:hypothetical protein